MPPSRYRLSGQTLRAGSGSCRPLRGYPGDSLTPHPLLARARPALIRRIALARTVSSGRLATSKQVRVVAAGIAHAMLAGAWTDLEVLSRIKRATGRSPPWMVPWVEAWVSRPRPPEVALIATLLVRDLRFRQRVPREQLRIVHWFEGAGRAHVSPHLPAWHTVGDVAAGLAVSDGVLSWLADTKHIERTAPPGLRRYRSRWIHKASGGYRLIEAPRPRLLHVQRRLLSDLLDRLPVHPAALGFRRGGSALAHARSHAGQPVVLRLDLEDFFPSTPRHAVERVFRWAGYRRPVARVLAGLCTTVTTSSVFGPPTTTAIPLLDARRRSAARLRQPHLPQGAPTSPALANLCAHHLDERLSALAARAGLTYSRYADDLAFSGAVSTGAMRRLAHLVARIVADEGYRTNEAKTKVMTASVQQRLTGVVVNVAPAVARAERDRLEAILFNCVRHGPADQNREGHSDFRSWLAGRIAWVAQVNERHAVPLRALFERIEWERASDRR